MGFSVGGLTGANSSAKKAAELQFAYQKKILQNQHQWEMQDLEKAGLNPALTLGDSALSGSSASAGMPNMGGNNDAIGGLINSAISAFTAKKQAETGDTQGQLNLAQAENIIAQTKNLPEQIKNDTIRAIASQIGAQASMKQAQIAGQLAPATKEETETRTEQNKQGWLGKILGTENYDKGKGYLGLGMSIIPGIGLGYKGYRVLKSINSARKFGKGLWR